MIPKDCKRLAEVDFPIAVVSRHFRRGRSPSGMDIVHLWWARRPLAAWSCSYAVISTLLSVISTEAERSRAARRDSLSATDTCPSRFLPACSRRSKNPQKGFTRFQEDPEFCGHSRDLHWHTRLF